MRHRSWKWLVVGAVLLGMLAGVAVAGAETTPFFARLITPTNSDQFEPSIWGSRVAFTDQRNGNDDVYLYNLSTNAESQVTTVTSGQSNPDLSEDHLVYEDNSSATTQIAALNLLTGARSMVTSDTAYNLTPKTDGHMATYVRRAALGEQGDIYAYDLREQVETAIATGTADQRDPAISGDRIAWLDERNGSTDVYVYDMATKTESRVTTDGADPTEVAIYDNTVVYSDARDPLNWDLYVHDLAIGTDRRIAASDNDEAEPDIWGSRVVYIEDVAGSENVVVHDLRTNATVTLVDDTGDANEPSIYRNRVAYTYLGATYEVYVGTILVPAVTISAPTHASYGTTATVTGTLTSVGGVALEGRSITVESSTDRVTWSTAGTVTTDASGGYRFTTPAITAPVWLRAVYAPADELSSESSEVLVAPRYATALSIRTSAKTISYQKWPKISGNLTNRNLNGIGIVGKRVYLEGSSNGKTFTVSASTLTTAGGAYSFTGKPTNKRWYRVVFRGDEDYASSRSSTITVTPRVSLTTPSTATSVRRNSAHSASGYLRPRHKSGSKPVRIQAYRRQSGRWVLRRTFTATVSNYRSYSRYRATIRLPYTGTWRIRAYAPADSAHAATYSSYRTVRVR